MKIRNIILLSSILVSTFYAQVREYVVLKTNESIVIDGKLTEPQWENALLTEPFVKQETGDSVLAKTQAKLLWDDENLYIGFIAYDSDVWGKMTIRDSHLWKEEPVEVFIEPNSDKYNYLEIEINSLGTELDLFMDKSYLENGTADFGWNLVGLKSAVYIDGTLNDNSDTDSVFYCEIAIPFSGIDTIMTNPLHNPPIAGESWRINLARYNCTRNSIGKVIKTETSCWNKTGTPSFHVPEKFGRIIFSDEFITDINNSELVMFPAEEFELIGNYPNPFNPSTKIQYSIPLNPKSSLVQQSVSVKLIIYDILGREVTTLVNERQNPGRYEVFFDAKLLSSGIYFYQLKSGNFVKTKKMLLAK